MSIQRRFIAIGLICALGLGIPSSRAQDLDEDIDAELDNVAEGESGNAAAENPEDIEVDLGDEDAEATTDNATPESGLAPDTASTPPPVEDDGDDLSMDGEEESVAQPAPSPTPAAEPDSEIEPDVIAEPEPETEDPLPVAEPEPEPESDPIEGEAAPKKTVGATNLFSEPNAATEERLHRIVKGFKDVPDTEWAGVVGMKSAELYPIQPRDTLWDISNTFFGDGFFWAKLWSQNDVIENPHLILRGKTIRFVAGTEAQAPVIGLTDSKLLASNTATGAKDDGYEAPTYKEDMEGELTQEDLDSGIALETSELIPAPEIPPPNRRAPVMKSLPRSFREKTVTLEEQGYDASGLRGAPAIRAREPAVMFLNSWVTDQTPIPWGTVVEIDAQEKLATVGQDIIVKLNNPASVGDRLTIAKTKGKISGAPGPVVELGGVVQIVGVVRDKKNTYVARVKAISTSVEVGSMVLGTPPTTFAYSRSGRRSETEVTILGGEFDTERKVIGEGSVVYLNGGAAAGLKVGDLLGVQERRESRRISTAFPDIVRPIGILKVVEVRPKVATGVLIEAFEEVRPGDVTGGAFPDGRPLFELETATEAVAPFKKSN